MKETYKHEFNWWQRILAKVTTMWRINSDSIDFKWGYFAPRFGLELRVNQGGYFDPRYSFSFCFIWGVVHIVLPLKTKRELSCECPTYGFYVFENSIIWRWNWIYKSWDAPFVSYVFEFYKVLNKDGKWEDGSGSLDNENIDRQEFDYTYQLNSGDIQNRKATCFIEKRQWHRKWLPFIKMTCTQLSVEFDGEVGEKTGTWKGGCIGCNYDMLPKESVEQCLRRMEKEREF
ncbi:hypothetical protein [Shewanella fodinae]|uniref:hypothetical protein n=1 Tax=Shewanella fodinae TaxID=552357 RepID=UPI00167BA227|nr:hypothetical protein [Shewanella fodinae]MCL2905213.1 hypothetical protein [Shewanella fodinae]GGY87721.1 hypothetical protein GCM10007169_01110 [Shewanella fodinae]